MLKVLAEVPSVRSASGASVHPLTLRQPATVQALLGTVLVLGGEKAVEFVAQFLHDTQDVVKVMDETLF